MSFRITGMATRGRGTCKESENDTLPTTSSSEPPRSDSPSLSGELSRAKDSIKWPCAPGRNGRTPNQCRVWLRGHLRIHAPAGLALCVRPWIHEPPRGIPRSRKRPVSAKSMSMQPREPTRLSRATETRCNRGRGRLIFSPKIHA